MVTYLQKQKMLYLLTKARIKRFFLLKSQVCDLAFFLRVYMKASIIDVNGKKIGINCNSLKSWEKITFCQNFLSKLNEFNDR